MISGALFPSYPEILSLVLSWKVPINAILIWALGLFRQERAVLSMYFFLLGLLLYLVLVFRPSWLFEIGPLS